MCGIIGCVGREDETLDVLVHGLSKLEYRGYDSAGVALSGERVDVCKKSGEIDDLKRALESRSIDGAAGIGHTRWSTHGPPTDANAHPHLDCTGDVAVVHNGIIENYQSLRDELATAGHTFKSDTDTEVVPHLVEDALADGLDNEAAVREAISRLEGSYAVAVVVSGDDTIYAARNDSPLVLGIDDGDAESEPAYYLASDVPAFRDFTDRVVYLADGEFATLSAEGWRVSDVDGTTVDKDVDTVDWDPEETGKSGYDHFMLKEIHEQPRAIRQCLRGRVDEMTAQVDIGDLGDLSPTGVQFVACGTSYHAALYGAQLLRDAGIPAHAFLASEYATSPPPIGDALVVGVTQSGETADTLSALREARKRGARTLAVTNTVGSTAARECDHALYIRAGPEIGVAASKTFASQLVALNLFSLGTTRVDDVREVIGALRDLPSNIQAILDDSRAESVAGEYVDSDAYFFIGRGLQYPVALEGALKMKEITYKHAEGFAAGELKHGPLALVTGETPVFAVVTGDGEMARKTIGNVKEVEARDAPVVAVTDGQSDVGRYADAVLEVPETHPQAAAVLANVQLQLVSYHVADKLGRSIDKPRNLAKSVTVE
ncbi:glutamine--fructose-6-phosphate transaminase (isomerizing) [Halosimplex litoreum]|uniref:Glutamine--fructose-6-phosphate aminotransferase [isomerizing] n=1 Tax=Halosimplex litoreum TaxID=1198301 RepID=A0A7T3FYQ6_9EURY|nr:glutamine--fructose-6-phosphate transaminase (isomerizing) [Halosimplex litoreum]QPV63213.1 glutamine--fructose-6-phosphate transaminase (isomerizing) [Halosimplex litoreum]